MSWELEEEATATVLAALDAVTEPFDAVESLGVIERLLRILEAEREEHLRRIHSAKKSSD